MHGSGFRREDYRGIFSAILTPLTEEEALDEGAFEALAHALLEEGQAGLYITGGTGEAFGISDEVRVAAFKIAARVARARGGNAKIIAHVGGVHTRRGCALARAAAEAGCDAIAAIPPYGGKYSFEELIEYYACLAKASPLPTFVYHVPHASGYDFPRERITRWLELPNVMGLKFTSHDLFKLERLATLHADKVLFNGPDEILMSGLSCGAVGAIGLCYNLVGPLALKIHAAVRRGDTATALAGQGALNEFIEAYFKAGSFQAFKMAAARRYCWQSSRSPAPALPASTETVDALTRAMDSALRCARELE